VYTLPPLPYPTDALAPLLGAETLHIHHARHHARYVNVTNDLVRKQSLAPKPLEQRIVEAGEARDVKLFNNAAQAWNHAFFWESMTPTPCVPTAGLLHRIGTDFGGVAPLRQQFVSQGVAHFGSGWVWLVCTDRKLSVVATHDAELPMANGSAVPLLVCDVWEHAYYLDYKNDRERFLNSWFEKLANWRFAERQYAAATAGAQGYRYPEPVP
jgi:Fe-Mn family superoxide dismutase